MFYVTFALVAALPTL